LVNPVTVTGEDAAEPINDPGVDIAEYEVIAEPPMFEGAVTGISAEESPATGVPGVGALGFLSGS
jgi:hypothetical protein